MENIEQYTLEEFEEFAKGIKKASDILKSEKPDYIFAPVIGAVPFVDLFFISDRHFNLGSVEYPPNSSRIRERSKIMSHWYKKFLEENYHGEKMEITCIDEVISGASAVKGYQEFRKALYEFGQDKKERLEKKIKYKILGIGEKPMNGDRNHTIKKLINSKIARIVDVKNIITADNVNLNPVRLKVEKTTMDGRHIYSPKIEKFYVSGDYLTLLQNFASYVGSDPSKVTTQNLGKMTDSLERYLLGYKSEK